ncbi:cypher isoform b [Holotrichia oblita]|uniref:Cypher isoform b n=1 Tax=Holotrichia oblita TaxID=644536 RepID=A0ACB9TLC9_HOLOL|nr:cypher isoform b [Holotrichia oblita]
MVHNILQWLEGSHRQVRQNGIRTYLPPTKQPRPFELPPIENIIPGMVPPSMPGYYEEPLLPHPQIPDITYPDEFPPNTSPEYGPNEITGPTITSSPYPEEPESNKPVQPPEEVPHVPLDIETPSPPVEEPSSSTDITGYQSSEPPFPPVNSPSQPEPEHNGYPPAGEQPQPPFELPGTPESHSSPPPDYDTSSPIEPVPIPTDEPLIPSQPASILPEPTGYPGKETPDNLQPTGYPFPETPQPSEIPAYTSVPPAPVGDASTFPPILVETTRRTGDEQPESETPSLSVPSSPTEEEPNLPGDAVTPLLPEVNSITPISEVTTGEPKDISRPSLPDINPTDIVIQSQPTEHEISPEPTEPEGQNQSTTEKEGTEPSNGTPTEEDLKHPPHVHTIDVDCAKEMMTINIEFNRQFDGIIYSKGFYSNPECRYVNENSGQSKYTFTVKLDSCGTQFINAFDTQNQSYLENVLVLQNEAGIQEVWDTIRSVRCLWEGNLSKSLTVSLSVGMLSEEIVTFSGDTAVARLDIQKGEGPFAPSANGLVPIGEKMTLVISVSGDPGFDIQVKDCKAKNSEGNLEYALTDEDGCVLRPKLFGAFQKTRDTGNTDASIIAYAYFNAFKFPDLMDLMIECNVDLCKTDCDVCPNPDQKIQPGKRRRRDLRNETIGDPVKIGKLLRVLLPEDLSDGETLIEVKQEKEFCISLSNFVFVSVILIVLLTCSILYSAYMYLKYRITPYKHEL